MLAVLQFWEKSSHVCKVTFSKREAEVGHVQAELISGPLVENVQAVGGVMQLGITVPDLTRHSLSDLCQILYLVNDLLPLPA